VTPLEQVRFWARRAPIWQRVSAGLGAALVVGLLGVLVVPIDAPQGTDRLGVASGAFGAGAAAPATSSTTDTTAAPTAAGPAGAAGTVATGAAAKASAAAGCISPPGGDQGITANEMHVAILLIALGGAMANSLVGVPSLAEQQADYDAVIDDVNTHGGVACHKVVPHYYQGNPIDSTALQQVCLQIVQDKPFFVIDGGNYFLYPQLLTCYSQHTVPIYSVALVPLRTQRSQYPYLFASAIQEVVHHNAVLGLGQRGWFGAGNGFAKLGLLYRSCNADLPGEMMSWLAQAGVPAGKIVRHDVGCPAATAPPSDLQQAVLDFKTNGVTHVVMVEDEIDFANFTTLAERQGFRPKYSVPDSEIGQTYVQQHPDFDNITNAISITQTRMGEERTPGMAPTGQTAACDAILVAHHRPKTYVSPDGLGGNDCNALWMLKAAAEHAPALRRDALAPGLQASGTLDLAFPRGPADFRAPYTTYGGQMWRVAEFVRSCACWRVTDATFHPSFR